MPAQAPSIEEILSEIRAWDDKDGEGKTVQQLADSLGLSPTTVRKHLRAHILSGQVQVKSVRRESPFRPGCRLPHLVYVFSKEQL